MTKENDTVGQPFDQRLANPEDMTDQALETLGYNKPHVHCIGPTLVGVFDTGSEAIKAYEAYENTVVIMVGENQSKVSKSDIVVMSENEFECL